MSKTLRYILFLTAIIASINFFFTALTIFIGFSISHSIFFKIFLTIISSIVSGGVIAYLVISTSSVARDFLHTFRHLLRLESLSHPLMVKFSHDAPGTYHHTLNIANIASRAAKTIGADSLLTRVAAYYHDIGKMSEPDNYVENQKENNTHDEIDDPKTSAHLIINHVNKGIELAKENHLPQEIIDCIQQHHGTTTVTYFYQKAKNNDSSTKKSEFRYPGPKPLSKEAAILMLSDSIEAAVRAFPKPTPEDIKNTITTIIEERTADNQLSLSGLTTANLTKIHQSFQESLNAIFHQRIDYPKSTKRK